MNKTVNDLYAEYLDHTGGDKAAAASLTLADTLQRTLDAKAEPVAQPVADGLLNIGEASHYLGCTPHGLRKIVARTQASQMGQRVNGPTIEFFQSRKKGPIRFRQEWLDAFIEKHHLRAGLPAIPKQRRQAAKSRNNDPMSVADLWASSWHSNSQPSVNKVGNH